MRFRRGWDREHLKRNPKKIWYMLLFNEMCLISFFLHCVLAAPKYVSHLCWFVVCDIGRMYSVRLNGIVSLHGQGSPSGLV